MQRSSNPESALRENVDAFSGAAGLGRQMYPVVVNKLDRIEVTVSTAGCKLAVTDNHSGECWRTCLGVLVQQHLAKNSSLAIVARAVLSMHQMPGSTPAPAGRRPPGSSERAATTSHMLDDSNAERSDMTESSNYVAQLADRWPYSVQRCRSNSKTVGGSTTATLHTAITLSVVLL